ncbi:MAG: hypothetical protein KAS16_08290 [Thermoplasmata archaeon]|nr:hypothetical protein [Thermoplasmata archaeon]
MEGIDDIHEEVEKPPINKKEKWLMISVVILVVIIVISSLSWLFIFRPISIEELCDNRFEAGDVVSLSGTITNITKHKTNYGTFSVLTLDDFKLFQIAVNESDYQIGDKYNTELRFQEYTFNGNKVISAPELIHSYMILPSGIGVVMDAVAYVSGFYFNLTSNNNGVIEYTIIQSNTSHPLSDFNLSLRKGQDFETNYTHSNIDFPLLFAYEYVSIVGDYDRECEIDSMSSLENGTSDNGMVEFIDVNSDGLLGTDDIFRVHIEPTLNEYTIETYQLTLGDGFTSGDFPGGGKYIINWYDGAYQNNFDQDTLGSNP